MRKMLVVLVCGALFAGCANKEVAKKSEEPVAPSATTAPAPPQAQQQAPAPPPVVESAPAQSSGAQVAPETATGAKAAPSQPSSETMDAGQGQKASALQQELQKIYFDFDSAALSKDSRDALAKNAGYLKQNPSLKVRIEGNCDERGSDEYNLALGERRAKAAEEYLTTLGVPADQLSTISYGEERPVDQGHNEQAWSKNRRDEFVVIK